MPTTQNDDATTTAPEFIAAVVDRDAAEQRLTQATTWLSRGLKVGTRLLGGRSTWSEPCHVELLWLPYYYAVIQLQMANANPPVIELLINGCDRRVTFCDLQQVCWEQDAERTQFEPLFDIDEAKRIAAQAVLKARLRNKGWRQRHIEWEFRRLHTIHYPFWVGYYRRRGGRFDVRLVDGVTGEHIGPAGKVALLTALTSCSPG